MAFSSACHARLSLSEWLSAFLPTPIESVTQERSLTFIWCASSSSFIRSSTIFCAKRSSVTMMNLSPDILRSTAFLSLK